ncbi:rRNA maturation RNase YbeY [candidate division KSB1 bacterium]|nr:rRNA maturation RNase YbeY [candidate division KSB1 bacterium]
MKIECYETGEPSYVSHHQIKLAMGELIAIEKPLVDGEIRIIFIDDEYCKNLNRKYLEHDYTTDVISFHLESSDHLLEGEVYVNVDQAQKQASHYDVDVEEELWRLIIHGTLHLLGDNDSTSSERDSMRKKENEYLNMFEISRKEL